MREYFVNQGGEKHSYSFDYQEFKNLFAKYSSYSDEEFRADLPNIIHYACFISWFKELRTDEVLGDTGVVHELVHLLCLDGDWEPDFSDTRKMFNDTLAIT